jgi:hypothetical protein
MSSAAAVARAKALARQRVREPVGARSDANSGFWAAEEECPGETCVVGCLEREGQHPMGCRHHYDRVPWSEIPDRAERKSA